MFKFLTLLVICYVLSGCQDSSEKWVHYKVQNDNEVHMETYASLEKCNEAMRGNQNSGCKRVDGVFFYMNKMSDLVFSRSEVKATNESCTDKPK